jgi:hemerythrin-like metal-binding protein/PAS domain S-box-containing protein
VDGIIEQVNQAGIVLFGYEASEFVGLSLENFVEKKFYDNLSKALDRKDNRYIKDIISEEHQVVIYRKDNSSENVSMLIQPISSSGRIFYVISVSKSVDVIGQDLFQSRQVDKHIAKEFRDRIRIEELTEILKKNNIVVNDSLDENSLIEWSSEFEFGIDVIDEQHHKWIYFINKFHRALSEGAGNESLLETMRELIEYTDYHFNFEERYFKELMFVGAKEHIQAHASFVEHILAVQADFRMGKPDAAYKMVNYFKNWVQSHITIEDKQYVKLFKDNNVKYSMF